MKSIPQRKIFDGERYGLVSIPLHKTKKSALARAGRYKKKGHNVRIKKYSTGYAVYSKSRK